MTETPADRDTPDDDQKQHAVGEPLRDAWAFVYRSGYPRRSGSFTAASWGYGR